MIKQSKFGDLKAAAEPVRDVEVRAALNSLQLSDIHERAVSLTLLTDFVTTYDGWIRASTLNDLGQLHGYQRMCSFAVTHVLEQFLLFHRSRRFRILRGEYPGTRLLLEQNSMNWCWIEEDPVLHEGDAVIISVPFAGSGNKHPMTETVLEQAKAVNIPVLVDCAFFGFCSNINIDLASYDVETVAFSLSKCFNMPHMRVGMIMSKNPPPSVALLHNRGYVARTGMAAALSLFSQFSCDFLFNKYRAIQEHVCAELGLKPSDSVLFGLADNLPEWQTFDKDGVYRRVSFGAFLPQLWGKNAN